MVPAPAEAQPGPAALEAELGVDLLAMLAAIGVPVVEAVPVTTIPWAGSPRASFRLTLADGQVLKGRRLAAPADVIRIASLSSLLDPRYFPPVLALRGRALLTRWITGQPGSPRAWTSARLRACGRLQAAIHRLPVSPEIASLQPPALDWAGRLDRWLRELVALAGRSAPGTPGRSTAWPSSPPPRRQAPACCHTDFCGDNIIITDARRICVVDNEGITLDSDEFDLARTWYRWPMTPAQQRAYAEGYGGHDHSARFAAHFLHWALMAVLDSAAYRVRVGAASAGVPLDRLTELLRTHGRNESFPRFLSSPRL